MFGEAFRQLTRRHKESSLAEILPDMTPLRLHTLEERDLTTLGAATGMDTTTV